MQKRFAILMAVSTIAVVGPIVGWRVAQWISSTQTVVKPEMVAEIRKQKDTPEELANIRAMVIKLDPEIAELENGPSKLRLALRLRNLVYQRVPVSGDWENIDWYNIDSFVYSALVEDDKGLLCQGISAVYSLVLTAFGIENRNVAMFQTVDPIGSNHASVEVRIGDHWIAADPTFNVSFSGEEGKLLSWRRIAEQCQAGMPPVRVFGPRSPSSERSDVFAYYTSLCDLTEYMVWSPSRNKAARTMPEDWDGTVRTESGPFSVKKQFLETMPWTVPHTSLQMEPS